MVTGGLMVPRVRNEGLRRPLDGIMIEKRGQEKI